MCPFRQNLYTIEFKKLGLKIAYYRKLKGYTQEEVAEIMGVATSYIGAIEAPNMNKPISLTTLFRIARILDTPSGRFCQGRLKSVKINFYHMAIFYRFLISSCDFAKKRI